MVIEGLHHITIGALDAQRTIDFYTTVLGLRFVKKTVNFDDPTAYHLYFGDETGAPGSILTWFEFAGAAPGRAGLGMIHTLQLGVPSAAAIDFWQQRLAAKGANPTRLDDGSLRVADPDGLDLQLVVADDGNPPLQAVHPEVPAEHAITGLEGARAYSMFAGVEESVLTDVIDRDYFNAIYFREPRGVLFEIATLSPGFATDEDPEHLGEELRLPTQHEHLRAELERTLRPVVNPRTKVSA